MTGRPSLLSFRRGGTAILAALFLFSASAEAARSKKSKEPKLPKFAWSRVERELAKAGLAKPFIRELRRKYDKSDRARTLRLNILGFLNPTDHTIQVTDTAVEGARRFLAERKAAFDLAEKQFGVPREVVSSLLWIETRHGQIVGDFHVPSVYLTLFEGKQKGVRTALYRSASKTRSPAAAELGPKGLREKIESRTERKSDWALEELRALEKLWSEKKDILETRGSFAGAFGIPQFIPSSYEKWSCAAKPDAKADLSDPDDAIMSVANYLAKSGWGETTEAKRKAIYAYNHSEDYVSAILLIAEKARTN